MIEITQNLVDEYATQDNVDRLLTEISQKNDEIFLSQKWLKESIARRAIFNTLYGDFLTSSSSNRLRLLDVGGGFTALSRHLIKLHDYTLIELGAHESENQYTVLEQQLKQSFVFFGDWLDYSPKHHHDLVIANDVFPNCDQRLELFLNKFLPLCKSIKLSLTIYNNARWYRTRREPGEEILHILSWNGKQLHDTLSKFKSRLINPNLDILLNKNPGVFENGRQVFVVTLSGDL